MGDTSRVNASTSFSRVWRNSALPYLVTALPLVVLAVAGVRWWVKRELSRVEYAPDSKVLRAQLQKSILEAYEKAKAEADTVQDSKERQMALQEVERDRNDHLAEIDGFVGSIELPILAGNASPELMEFGRFLEQDELRGALAYLSSQESHLFALEKESHTSDLLLRGIHLRREQGDLAEAERLSEKLLAAEPESLPAVEEHFRIMMASGTRALRKGDLGKARQQFEKARASAEHLWSSAGDYYSPYSDDPRKTLVTAYERLAHVSLRMGDVDKARQFLQKGLEATGQLNIPATAQIRRDLLSLRDTIRAEHPESHPEIARAADRIDLLMNFQAKTPESLYTAACQFGLRAKLAAGWPHQGPFRPEIDAKAVDPKHQQEYVQAAIDLLEAAVKAGFNDISWLEHDPALEALHDLPQYKKIVNSHH